jgi:ABC-type molybdate transport system ATPase subunit
MKAEGLAQLEAGRDATATPMLYISHAAEVFRRLAGRVVTLRDRAVTAERTPRPVTAPVAAAAASGFLDLAAPAL